MGTTVTDDSRSKRMMLRINAAEMALIKAAASPAPVATWVRKAVVRRAKIRIKKRIVELEKIGGKLNDAKIVRLATTLEKYIAAHSRAVKP